MSPEWMEFLREFGFPAAVAACLLWILKGAAQSLTLSHVQFVAALGASQVRIEQALKTIEANTRT